MNNLILKRVEMSFESKTILLWKYFVFTNKCVLKHVKISFGKHFFFLFMRLS